MLQSPRMTLGFMKNMVYKISPGGGKPYPASGLIVLLCLFDLILNVPSIIFQLNRDRSFWVEPVLS